jgi:hypothetical protein
MSKLSERVRELYDDMNEARVAQTCNEAADALDACERALRPFTLGVPVSIADVQRAKDALAKLEAAR